MAELTEFDMIEEELEDNSVKDLYFCFEIDKEDYVLEVSNIKEIITMATVTPVPEQPHYLKGIINLRGDMLPVIDVRLRFGKEEKEVDELTCIAVVTYAEEYVLGLIVDRVKGTITIKNDIIAPPPNSRLTHTNYYIKSIAKTDEGVKLFLDLEKFLFL